VVIQAIAWIRPGVIQTYLFLLLRIFLFLLLRLMLSLTLRIS
jgi:hypothetical protein